MKIVIDIDEITYKLLYYSLRNGVLNTWEETIAKGKPLPINDIKSDINQIIVKNKGIRSVEAQERIKTAQQTLDIINKHTKRLV